MRKSYIIQKHNQDSKIAACHNNYAENESESHTREALLLSGPEWLGFLGFLDVPRGVEYGSFIPPPKLSPVRPGLIFNRDVCSTSSLSLRSLLWFELRPRSPPAEVIGQNTLLNAFPCGHHCRRCPSSCGMRRLIQSDTEQSNWV